MGPENTSSRRICEEEVSSSSSSVIDPLSEISCDVAEEENVPAAEIQGLVYQLPFVFVSTLEDRRRFSLLLKDERLGFLLLFHDTEMGMEKVRISIVVIGNVDSGKSTSTGHLFHEVGGIDKHVIARYSFSVTDMPGHGDFIKNMIIGTCKADCAVLSIDSTAGAFKHGMSNHCQTHEHVLLAFTLGVDQMIGCCNKMDATTPKHSEERYNEIVQGLSHCLGKVGYKRDRNRFVPISGLEGDNLRERSRDFDWCTISQSDQDNEKVTRSMGVRNRPLMNEAKINPSRVLEDEQDDEKVTRSNGVRKRLFINEANINPSIVLEDEQDNEKVTGKNIVGWTVGVCFLDPRHGESLGGIILFLGLPFTRPTIEDTPCVGLGITIGGERGVGLRIMKGTDSGFGLRITYGSLLGVELEGTKGGGYVAGIGVTNGEGSGVELEGTNEGGCGVELGTTCEEVWGLALAVTDGGGWGEWLGFANGEGLGVWTAGGTCPIPSSSFSCCTA
ncbi:hypothetical protein MRB53_000121 [Persea americana]|uniref:Uncharacterized protein n=1 Tax=Persea americana TaxID=3435 RepID=A0ACC2MNZ5_PERAE|nr:hypothetical protein MRB53_000121 [Persea americana]